MEWPAVRATMVHGANPTTFKMLMMLRRSADWRTRWAPALRHPQHGHPPSFAPMLSTNAIAIEHAAHLFRFRQHTARDLFDTDCIIEFGGGFGSMCRLMRALGFRGRYIIFDLPPILALQRYYLGMHGIDASLSAGTQTALHFELGAIREDLEQAGRGRLSLISSWALTEMPLSLRQQIEPFFSLEPASLALVSYQPSFEKTDNYVYFRGLAERLRERWHWEEYPVDPTAKELRPGDHPICLGRGGRAAGEPAGGEKRSGRLRLRASMAAGRAAWLLIR
ncbi:MAG: hypothetical protein ACJ8AW_21880 [Rhodopila sp.]